ncbi:hypothetical protein NFI96_024408, partial [Prochilodus magdalenae]
EVKKAVLHVYSAVTKETLPVGGTVALLTSSVSRLRSLVSCQLGLPVSAFRLSTQNGQELYDCNLLSDYAVEAGDTLHMDTWDGWTEFLRACFQGHKCRVQCQLSEEKAVLRFQKRVALYVAATHGHLELASWLLDNGMQAQEPVGVHPYRVWCYEMDHQDYLKCPIHAAVEAGQLLVLKMFLSRNVLNLACGQNLLRIAIHHRHMDCVSYLVSKLYSVVTFPGFVVSVWLYVQIKRWIHKAKRGPLACGLPNRGPFRSTVGDTLLVDGFSLSGMSTALRGPMLKGCSRVKHSSCGFHALTSAAASPSCPSHRPAVLGSQRASVQLPQLLPPTTNKRRQKGTEGNNGYGRKTWKEILAAENTDRRIGEWKTRVPLPHSSQDTSPRPLFVYPMCPNSSKILSTSLESFTRLSGRTPRENAIYCLAMAR